MKALEDLKAKFEGMEADVKAEAEEALAKVKASMTARYAGIAFVAVAVGIVIGHFVK